METAVKERPILFRGEMVRAILSGAKSQTRRIVTERNSVRQCGERGWPFDLTKAWMDGSARSLLNESFDYLHVPYHHPKESFDDGAAERWVPRWHRQDRLWVRETWGYWEEPEFGQDHFHYYADDSRVPFPDNPKHPCLDHCVGRFNRKLPSIHMPRWASRITLEITDIRVQRLQDISEEDAVAEGSQCAGVPASLTNRGAFAKLWESINGHDSWKANPWIWALTFKRIDT